MLAPIGIMIIATDEIMNFFDFKLESGSSYPLDLPSIFGKNIKIRINAKKLTAKIQDIAI